MFCSECGTAIQIVPDYDLDIEESIAVSQDVISDSLSEITADGKRRVDQNTVELPATRGTAKLIDKTRIVVGIIAAVLAVVIIVMLVAYNRIRSGSSAENIMADALEAFESGDYEKSAQEFKRLLDSDAELQGETEQEVVVMYAKSLFESGDSDKALVVLSSYLERAGDNEAALTALLDIYAAQSDTDKINETISAVRDDALREKLSGYLSLMPEFSVPAGEYNEEFKLEITSSQLGNIYYTVDGSEPTVNSAAYSGAIDIAEGETTVRAIFVNPYGLVSEIATAEYTVNYDAPETPVVVPPSGSFTQPEYINLIVPDGVRAFYTTDGSDPDENSDAYEKQLTMPIGKSTFKFVFISDKGVMSPVTEVNYELNVAGIYSSTDALNYLTASLVATGHIVDIFGTPPGVGGIDGRYVYQCDYAAREGNRTYYLIDEYIEDVNGNRSGTGEVYAVDAAGGMLYRAKEDDEGKWSFTLFF